MKVALIDKGGAAQVVGHHLGLPVRTKRENRQVLESSCVQGSIVTLLVRTQACRMCVWLKLSIPLTDEQVARRYISKLDEVIQMTGRVLVP